MIYNTICLRPCHAFESHFPVSGRHVTKNTVSNDKYLFPNNRVHFTNNSFKVVLTGYLHYTDSFNQFFSTFLKSEKNNPLRICSLMDPQTDAVVEIIF